MATKLTLDEAIQALRRDPKHAALVRDVYLGEDVLDSARRFRESVEFEEVLTLLGDRLRGAVVLDLGSGVGIAARALADSGAHAVYALEPDASDLVGHGALRRLATDGRVQIVAGLAEQLPIADASVDIVYGRQVLHHIADLTAAMRECARVLRPGGCLLACREHVVSNERQRATFLKRHPIHRLAGGENAYRCEEYTAAIAAAGLTLIRAYGPWDTVINAYPAIKTRGEFLDYPLVIAKQRLGAMGALAARLPLASALIRWWLARPVPGRVYTFLAAR